MIKDIIFNKDLHYKHRIFCLITLNNGHLLSLLYTLYVKFMSIFNQEYSKKFSVKKLSKNLFKINTEDHPIHTGTIYRSLNFGRGLEWRINYLSNISYGLKLANINLTAESNVIDLGANIGEFSIFCARKGANVISLEHDKIVFEALKHNCENYIDKIKPFNYSISNTSENKFVYYYTLTGSTSLIEPNENKNIRKNFTIEDYNVGTFSRDMSKCINLDDLIDKNNLSHVDLIKSDCEGSEPEMVMGLNKNVQKVKYFTIDVGPERNGERTDNQVITLLEERNFQIIHDPRASKENTRVVIAKNKKFLFN